MLLCTDEFKFSSFVRKKKKKRVGKTKNTKNFRNEITEKLKENGKLSNKEEENCTNLIKKKNGYRNFFYRVPKINKRKSTKIIIKILY